MKKVNGTNDRNLEMIQSRRVLLTGVLLSSLLQPVLSKTALLIIDVQLCFLPGGSLPVTDGNYVIPVINNIRRKYEDKIALTVFSQDWHCDNHVSFASQHNGSSVYDVITLRYDSEGNLCEDQCTVSHFVNQTLWPDHCVINRTDAEISSQITRKADDLVVRKGYNCQVDSYSAFYDNGGFSKTELEDLLRSNGITTLIVTGLALDYCVFYTSTDAKKIGYDVYTVVDASRPVNQANVQPVLDSLRSIGVHVIKSNELDQAISSASLLNTHWILHTLCLGLLALVSFSSLS